MRETEEYQKALAQAEVQVEAFLEIITKRYGIPQEDIPKLLEDLKWVSQSRQSIHKAGFFAFMTLLGLIITGAVTAMVEGLKHIFRI